MVNILAENPSFSATIGRGIGAGLSHGVEKGAEFATQLGLEKFKQTQRSKLIKDIRNGSQQQPGQSEDFKQKFIDALPQMEQHLGRELQSQEVDQLWGQYNQMNQQQNQMQEDPFAEAEAFAMAGEHELAGVAKERGKLAEKRKENRASKHFEIAKETLKSTSETAQSMAQKETALEGMKEAISSGKLGFFTGDNLAEITGIEAFRSPEGSAFKTASKEFLMGNLSRIGSRGLNQWLEKQVADMAPKIGRSTEANLVSAAFLETEADLQKKQIDLTNKIADEMEAKFGYVKRTLSDDVRKLMDPYANEKKKELKSKIEKIKEKHGKQINKDGFLMRAPDGSLRRVPKKDFRSAKDAGYRLE